MNIRRTPSIARTLLLLLGITVVVPLAAIGQSGSTAKEFKAKLTYRQGNIDIGSGLATLNLSSEFRFLDPEQSRLVLRQCVG